MSKDTNKYAQRIRELGGHFYNHKREEPPSLSEEVLNAVEAELGYSLPTSYREFLRDFGEYDLNAYYPLQNGPDGYKKGSVGIMFAANGTNYDLVSFHNDNLDNDVIAPEILQLTGDEMGSVCLFLEGSRQGQVYLWYHDQAHSPYDYANLYFIAHSFDEFINLLYPIVE